jgi:hypothetical protein
VELVAGWGVTNIYNDINLIGLDQTIHSGF